MTEREPFAYLDQFRHKVTGDFLDGISIGGVRLIMGGSRELDKLADMINAAHEARVKEEVKKAVEEFRKRAAHKAASMCGVNPSTRRPCFEKESNKRFWCPICTNADEILALPTEPEGK